jgi:proline dehydrogenase
MLDAASKGLFHLLALIKPFKRLASRYGMRRSSSFARRFIAGETTGEAIEAARVVEGRGLLITLDYLGESVGSIARADAATREYFGVMQQVVESGIGRNISLKLTQLGLTVDRATCVDNMRRVLDRAEPAGFFVRIDMEGSVHTEVTLEIFETLWGLGYRQMGVVLQAALYRTEEDLPRVLRLGAPVRLVKGAYKEPKTVAHQHKPEIDDAYARLMKILLANSGYPAIATHDPSMHDLAIQWAAERGLGPDNPFGREWFPYFMRRLGERPANVSSVVTSIIDERRSRGLAS